MKKCLILPLLLLVPAAPLRAARTLPFLEYHGGSDYLPQTPSVTGGGAGAFANPAAWALSGDEAVDFWWDDAGRAEKGLSNWGFSTGRELGFAMQRRAHRASGGETYPIYDYQTGLAGGNRRSHYGVAFRWSGGRSGRVERENALAAGFAGRPCRHLSVGLSGIFSTHSSAGLGIFDVGVRPFGRPWVTLFGDFSIADDENLDGGLWGAGFELRPWRGIHLGMKAREEPRFDAEGHALSGDYRVQLNLGLTFDGTGFHVLPRYDEEGDRQATSYLLRFEPPYRGIPLAKILRRRIGKPRYVAVNLENKRITYQTARWFEKERIAWLDLARELDRIRKEPSARGIALNLAGTKMNPSIGWELREKLEAIRDAGKEVIIHFDRVGFTYYVASVADRLIIDPEGTVLIPGLALHRTYYRGLLDKVGVGVEEWRFFTHKSAMESYSRKEMSDADREQLGRLVDVVYETGREAICAGRGLSPERFDALVDEKALFTAGAALEAGLVDTIARWDHLENWLGANRGGAHLAGRPADRDDGVYPDEPWGRPKEVAVVYALGECAMDTGIKGRKTSAHMRKLAEKRDVAAVVLRADSPGGDALPSDLVAEATRKLKEAEKPVVVSQGTVAGSGGYWISMDGSKIFTTPITVTGSIGVIGGWFWDEGIGEKSGLSSDGIQRGRHADLFTGTRFPLLGTLPTRNLSGEEKDRIREIFLDLYGDFVRKVGEGRGLSEEEVRKIGEGRIWMGEDAIEKKLCDEVGGLTDALAEARRLAGIDPDEEIVLTEFPPRPRFRLPRLGGGPLARLGAALAARLGGGTVSSSAEETPSYDDLYLRAIGRSKGAPLVLTPPECLPEGWSGLE